MADKSSQTMMDTFVEIVEDLSCVAGESGVVKQIVMNIRNFMTDRAATERKFTDMLQIYRESIFRESHENWESMSDEQRAVLLRMFSQFSWDSLYMLSL